MADTGEGTLARSGKAAEDHVEEPDLRPADLHPWTLSPREAIIAQANLRTQLTLEWDGREVSSVGGVDVSVKNNVARAAIVALSYPELVPLEGSTAESAVVYPYIPGLLAFREGPVILSAWEHLQAKPDLLLFDGQGIAHPRGIGIASHMGLWLGVPSIGVAKSRLYGLFDPPGLNRGDSAHLRDESDPSHIIGAVLRTRTKVKPVFVSPGHGIDVQQSVHFVLQCCGRFRLPETTRWAHKVAGGEKVAELAMCSPS